jgi:Domain of unknown function (DUF3846)
MTIIVQHLTAKGTAEFHRYPADSVGMDLLKQAVGGYFEPISLGDGLTLWVNEEGRLLKLPINGIASNLLTLCAAVGQATMPLGGPILRGDALLTGGEDAEGNTLGLPPTYMISVSPLEITDH